MNIAGRGVDADHYFLIGSECLLLVCGDERYLESLKDDLSWQVALGGELGDGRHELRLHSLYLLSPRLR